MRILLTSDWQLTLENLPSCQEALVEILQLAKKYDVKVLAHCGDWKQQYDPINVRVVNWTLGAVGQLKKAGLEVIVCLGNHDRVGMHVDKQNWLPVLRKGGAKCFDEPGFVDLDGSSRIGVLPFRQSPVLFAREAYDLARRAKPDSDLLVFHAELKSVRYNVLTTASSEVGIPVKDLCRERYLYCIGGHIHFQQNVEKNVWYVGSPFATDWGEANQRKGYLLFDTETKELKQIRSKIPGWFDPDWPGFWEPESWQGARVRIKVPVGSTKHIQEELRRAKEKAERKYKGAEIVVVPELEASAERGSRIRAEWPDKKKIESYAEETLPEELKQYKEKVIGFLIEQLNQVGGLQRAGGELKFDSFKCKNALSFKELEVKLEPGLCVITGKNLDRKGKSNGSGKTSYLQIPAIALCGTTFKDQKHDAWKHRWTKKEEQAWAQVQFQDSKGRPCKVRRSRQPVDLRLKVNGDLLESGNRPEDTQRLIEQITGYTWETLSNAVYVDQTHTHKMLTGTEGERKGFLAKLQNLERFEKALKRVKDQKYDVELGYNASNSRLQSVSTEVKGLDLTLSQTKEIMGQGPNPGDLWGVKKAAYEAKRQELDEWEKQAEKQTRLLNRALAEERERQTKWIGKLGIIKGQQKTKEEQLENLNGMVGNVCPTCSQKVSDVHKRMCHEMVEGSLAGYEKSLIVIAKELAGIRQRIEQLEEKKSKWVRNKRLAQEVAELSDLVTGLAAEKKQYEGYKKLLGQLKARKARLLEQMEEEKQKLKKKKRWLSVIEYAMAVFARNGLPAYLNAQICPQLNQAAEKYAELFTQREIQVRFAVDEEGRMDVQVINANGGEGVEDQSEGEMKVASLITSFAVREVAPKTNLLILDEPGDGLDALSARQFARGLKQIVGKFGCILLTSHNQNILSELASEKMITVVKKDGVSRVEE